MLTARGQGKPRWKRLLDHFLRSLEKRAKLYFIVLGPVQLSISQARGFHHVRHFPGPVFLPDPHLPGYIGNVGPFGRINPAGTTNVLSAHN